MESINNIKNIGGKTMLSKELTKKLNECIKKNRDVSIEYKILKLIEEVGELSGIYLAHKDKKNKSKSNIKELKEKGNSAIIEEALDVMIVILDIIDNLKKELNIYDDEVMKIFESKINKWSKKQ